MFMNHRHYMKPTIKLVQLRQQRHILAGSNLQSKNVRLKNYDVYNEVDE